MRKLLFFVALFLSVAITYAQELDVEKLFTIISIPQSKFENFLSKNGYAFAGEEEQNDTVLRRYDNRGSRNIKKIDSVTRSVYRCETKHNTFVTYETASPIEYEAIKSELQKAGFYCNNDNDGGKAPFLLYQNKNLLVRISVRKKDTINMYAFLVHKKIFPKAKEIFYADDLLTFTSHEYLAYYFGEKNVQKDIYFFSGTKIAKCSVLFQNSNRQVVFIWADEDNLCTISHLLFGGQQNLESSLESGKYIEENNWALKSGVRPGMSLLELRMLNGNDFSFYGGNSARSGSILHDNKGKLNFKKEEIILGCLNCGDDKFSTARVVNADDSIEEGRILFVLSVILNPL